MQIQQIKLDNQLETLFVDSPGSTACTVQIWFRAGSALESKENQGIAHFLEHMFFKGTPKRPGASIAHEVESFGGEINAFTSFDYTCYYINTPTTHLNKTIEILMDMVCNPNFLEEDIVPERGVVFEEYRRSQDSPNHYAFHKVQKSFLLGKYNHPILGTEETIKNFSREQLIEFRNNFYNQSNSLLVVAGDLKEKEKHVKTIESFSFPKGPSSEFEKLKLRPTSTLEVHQKETRMCQLNLVTESCSYMNDEAASEDLAMNCMGHGESSRLFRQVVAESGMGNSASASTMFMNNGGLHFTKLVFPEKNLKRVTQKYLKIIKEIQKKGLQEEEVQKIKNQYIASKIYDKETIEAYAFTLGHGFAQNGNIKSEDEFIDRIKTASVDDVNNSFKHIISRPTHISLQLPLEGDKAKAKKLLQEFKISLGKFVVKKAKNIKLKGRSKLSAYDPQVKVFNLKKGISLIYRYNNMVPTSVFHTYLKGGLTEETEANNGIHNFISGMLTKGHGKFDEESIKTFLENKSASLCGFSGKNAYGLTLQCQTQDAKELFSHSFESLLNPTIDKDLIEREKELILRNIDSHTEDPVYQCFRIVSEIMFSKHPYALKVQGSQKTVSSFNKRKLNLIHSDNLKNKEILFTYCGDLKEEKLLELLSPFIEKLAPRVPKKSKDKAIEPLKDQIIHLPMDREQSQIFIGVPTFKFGSKENVLLKMLTTHLSGQSSELFVEVRDKQGLCYSAQPINFNALEGGYWGIYIASGHDKSIPAVKALNKLLDNIRDNGIGKDEFERIKKMIEGQNLLNIQTNEDYASIYSIPVLHGFGIDHFYKKNMEIEDLSYEDFQKGIKKVLTRKRNTVIVGREIGN